MTKPITFPMVKGTKVRRNAETGIEIHPQGRDGYVVYRTERDGSLSYWGDERTFAHAKWLATEKVEMVREEIAMDQAEAIEHHYWVLRDEHAAAGGIVPDAIRYATSNGVLVEHGIRCSHADAIKWLCAARKSDYRDANRPVQLGTLADAADTVDMIRRDWTDMQISSARAVYRIKKATGVTTEGALALLHADSVASLADGC